MEFNKQVKEWQQDLAYFGHNIEPDGKFGSKTLTASRYLLPAKDKPDSPHFSYHEFQTNGEEIPQSLWSNVQAVMDELEAFRDYIGRAIYIRAAYRSPAYNKAVGGASASKHLSASAVDIYASGMTSKEMGMKALEFFEPYFLKSCRESDMVRIGIGLGGSTIVHIDFGLQLGDPDRRPNAWYYDGSTNLKDWL
jgi:hypothetical protein